MREYAKKPENQSRTLDSNPRASKQASISQILQTYRNRTVGKPVQRQSADKDELLQPEAARQDQVNTVSQQYTPEEDEELLQGKFETVQREELDEDELLQGKFESESTAEQAPVQREEKPNNTGLPDNLKSGVENLSGYSMDDVRVHYNSNKPTQLQALAYTQGTNIHVAPGQEKHLPHEAWHVVQQKQGRVQPTMQMQGVNVNDNEGLEKEADVMGGRSNNLQLSKTDYRTHSKITGSMTIQQVNAYRVGTSASKYKITVDRGHIIEFKGGKSGIDISFVNNSHANHYFDTKKGDVGAELVSWDFPDDFYNGILWKMRCISGKKANKDIQNIWNSELATLPIPENSSDKYVTENELIAPHFQLAWIETLNKYGKGKNAKITTHGEFFGEESDSDSHTEESSDDKYVFAYKSGEEKEGFVISYDSRGDYSDYLFVSPQEAIKKKWANTEDFEF